MLPEPVPLKHGDAYPKPSIYIRFNVNNSNNKNARSVSSRGPEVPTTQNGGVKGVKGVLEVLEVSAGGWVSSPHWEHTHHSHFDQIDRRTGVDLGVRHLQSRKSPGLGDFVGGNRVQSFRYGECHFLTEGTQYPGTIRSANSVNNQKLFSSPNPKLKNNPMIKFIDWQYPNAGLRRA